MRRLALSSCFFRNDEEDIKRRGEEPTVFHSKQCMSDSTPPSPSLGPTPSQIVFAYVWTAKITTRKTNEEDAVILLVSPKFATVHQHISFQWNLRIHATTGRLTSDEEDVDYVTLELYFIDGPVSRVHLKAEASLVAKDEAYPNTTPLREGKRIEVQRGVGGEMMEAERDRVSKYIKENVGRVVQVSVTLQMDTKLFDPFTYLDAVSPTPRFSFLTANYNARVNSKIWRRRSRKRSTRSDKCVMSIKEKTNYEKKFQSILDEERESLSIGRLRVSESDASSRRASLISQYKEEKHHVAHDHIFKKILVSCCESCEMRRNSFRYDSRTEDSDSEHEEEESEDEPHFECDESDKEHVHDMLANLYFNKIVLPTMEYVEDFVDFLIDAELNDLPVLKRSCERYLCSELNTKKELATSLLLDLLFNAIVFNLPVMKSMTLSELANRTHEFVDVDSLLRHEEYSNLDKRMRNLADRSLVELVEQCVGFRDQKARVRVMLQDGLC